MPLVDNPTAYQTLLTRDQTLAHLEEKPWCDVCVIGGGIHGATFAHLSALHGLRTVLFERGDYAEGTSSRSSKLAHGGVRYLEHGDLRQVWEGIRERENLLHTAPHLVSRQPFLALNMAHERWRGALTFAGLSAYALMAAGKAALPRIRAVPPFVSPQFGSAIGYDDGILSDARLVIERVLAARQEGAHCLNYVETVLLLSQPDGVEVRYRDNRGGGQGAIRAGIVVNTAGVSCAQSGGLTTAELSGLFKFSRGSHLLFNKPWVGPALVLPIREGGVRLPGRYYFITPHPGGTLVGTTEREVKECERDPLPSEDEIQELLARVAKDVPGAGLSKDSAYYCFAGYRALPAGEGRVDALSRRHRWVSRKRILTLVGGKYTTAAWTCEDGFSHLQSISGLRLKRIALSSRIFPGAAFLGTRLTEFQRACGDAQVPPHLVDGAIRRFGGRVVRLLEWPDGLESVGDLILKGELRLAIEHEQAETVEDVLRRRIEIEQLPGHGIPQLEAMAAAAGDPMADDHQLELYRKRMSQIRELIDRD